MVYYTSHGALAQLGAHNTGSVGVRGSSPLCSTKKSTSFEVLFLSIAEAMAYHHDAVVDIISPFGAVSHHALACIFLRLDDIQHFVLMICNSYGIDDIQGSRLDFCKIS